MTDEWPCANFTEPVTCLSAGVTETGRCDHCRNQPEMTRVSVLVNEDCANYLYSQINAGQTTTEVIRQAIALHKFMSEDGLARIQRAEQVIERAQALIPNECWVLRSTADGPVCTDMVGGGFKDGPKWTEDMCCLPCRLRAALATNTT